MPSRPGRGKVKRVPRIFNRKFSDESRAFLPELAVNLRSDCKGWLATWNPHVQLGRPSSNSVLSRAFALTNLLSCFTSNPFLLYNALVLLTVGLTALFFLLFLRSLGLHWAACSCATLGLAFTTPALLLALLHHVCLGHLLASLSIVAYYRIHSQAIVANCARTHLCDLLSASNFLSAGHRVVSLHNRHLYPHKNSANPGRMERKSMACAGTGGLRRCRFVSCAAGLPRPVLYCA